MYSLFPRESPYIAISLVIIFIFLYVEVKKYYYIPIIIFFLMIIFYRDYNVNPTSDDYIMSPADGKVIKVTDNEVNIFLNVHNIHVQKSPIQGKITNIDYNQGSFNPAGMLEKSEDNEQMIFTIQGDNKQVKVSLIAGVLVRRIHSFVKVGDSVKQGQNLGMIKFGSRVDIEFENVRVLVKEGDRVSFTTKIAKV